MAKVVTLKYTGLCSTYIANVCSCLSVIECWCFVISFASTASLAYISTQKLVRSQHKNQGNTCTCKSIVRAVQVMGCKFSFQISYVGEQAAVWTKSTVPAHTGHLSEYDIHFTWVQHHLTPEVCLSLPLPGFFLLQWYASVITYTVT